MVWSSGWWYGVVGVCIEWWMVVWSSGWECGVVDSSVK